MSIKRENIFRKIRDIIKRKPMTDEQYNKKLNKARVIAKDRKRKQKIREAKDQWKPVRTKKKYEFSKVIVFLVFLMCMEILIFSQFLLWNTQDTSALYSLIAIPSTLVPTLLLYYTKAKAENLIKLDKLSEYISGDMIDQQAQPDTETQIDVGTFTGGSGVG